MFLDTDQIGVKAGGEFINDQVLTITKNTNTADRNTKITVTLEYKATYDLGLFFFSFVLPIMGGTNRNMV